MTLFKGEIMQQMIVSSCANVDLISEALNDYLDTYA